MAEPAISATASKLTRFLSHPIAGAIGWGSTVLALLLSVYFYFVPQRHRELSFIVHPARTVIVKSGQLSRLSAFLDGKPITTDLTAVQVALWNEGNEAIRSEHLLSPLVVKVSAPILDVVLLRQSRDVVGLQIDKTNAAAGTLTIRWNILEGDDGASLQLIYAGGPEAGVVASAVVEQQPAIKVVNVVVPSGEDRYEGKREIFLWSHVRSRLGMLVTGPVLTLVWLFLDWARPRQPGRFRRTLALGGLLTLTLGILAMLTLVVGRDRAPPFGF